MRNSFICHFFFPNMFMLERNLTADGFGQLLSVINGIITACCTEAAAEVTVVGGSTLSEWVIIMPNKGLIPVASPFLELVLEIISQLEDVDGLPAALDVRVGIHNGATNEVGLASSGRSTRRAFGAAVRIASTLAEQGVSSRPHISDTFRAALEQEREYRRLFSERGKMLCEDGSEKRTWLVKKEAGEDLSAWCVEDSMPFSVVARAMPPAASNVATQGDAPAIPPVQADLAEANRRLVRQVAVLQQAFASTGTELSLSRMRLSKDAPQFHSALEDRVKELEEEIQRHKVERQDRKSVV